LKDLTQLIEKSQGSLSANCEISESSDSIIPYKVVSFRLSGDFPSRFSQLVNKTVPQVVDDPLLEVRFKKAVQLYKDGVIAWKRSNSDENTSR